MANVSSEIIVGGSGSVYVAETTDTAPTDATTALAAAWKDFGYLTEDGVTISDSKSTEDIMAWQSFYPVRSLVVGRTLTVSFTMMQWNESSLPFALGGGTLTVAANTTYVPPTTGDVDERALVINWNDDTKDYRLYIPRGVVSEEVEIQVAKNGAAVLPITFKCTPASTQSFAWKLFTDDQTGYS